MVSSSKVWFITGSSTGFGRAMAELLLKKGDKVVATLRKPEALASLSSRYSRDQLLVLKLDVTKDDDIKAAFVEAHKAFGRIDVVFNNAGFLVIGEVEGASEANARRLFETNFWGAASVSKEAVRFFREVNEPSGGRLLQVSSAVGLQGFAGVGFYSATKFGKK
ncbi:hypothetical protein HYDPIDRAFT_26098 [Hydnomerulius pinastri MD-312]|nr:hypothetical protein HYDPIDRAFT_26098 [Hydnomerulius pinastri MD-312]